MAHNCAAHVEQYTVQLMRAALAALSFWTSFTWERRLLKYLAATSGVLILARCATSSGGAPWARLCCMPPRRNPCTLCPLYIPNRLAAPTSCFQRTSTASRVINPRGKLLAKATRSLQGHGSECGMMHGGMFGMAWTWKQHERYYFWQHIAYKYQNELKELVPELKIGRAYYQSAEDAAAKIYTHLFAKKIHERWLWVSLHGVVAAIGIWLMAHKA